MVIHIGDTYNTDVCNWLQTGWYTWYISLICVPTFNYAYNKYTQLQLYIGLLYVHMYNVRVYSMMPCNITATIWYVHYPSFFIIVTPIMVHVSGSCQIPVPEGCNLQQSTLSTSFRSLFFFILRPPLWREIRDLINNAQTVQKH